MSGEAAGVGLTRVLYTRQLRTDVGPPGRWDHIITSGGRQVVLSDARMRSVVQLVYDQHGIAPAEAAHACDLAALRERAEVAEAKVAAVWDEGRESGAYWSSSRGRPVDPRLTPPPSKNPYRAALADRPAGGEGR